MSNEKTEDLMSIFSVENEHHVYFHATLDKYNASTFCQNITSFCLELKNNSKQKRAGFSAEDTPDDISEENKIYLHINSLSGSFSAAFLMADMIKQIPFPVCSIAEGIISGPAIILFLACPERKMTDSCYLYISDTIHSLGQVPYNKLEKFVKECRSVNEQYINFIKEKTQQTTTKIKQLIKDERGLDKTEALTLNFINSEN